MSVPNPATTDWIPLGGALDLVYQGAWSAGTYYDGDVVVSGGVAYLCVRQTTAAPTSWPGVGATLPGYGTTLPASPVDGQEFVLVDSTTNPTYQWRFRYNANSISAYKWEFIGGIPLYSGTVGSMSKSTTGFVPLTSGPTATAPRNGDYILDFGVFMQNTGWTQAYNGQAQIHNGASGSKLLETVFSATYQGVNTSMVEGRWNNTAAGTTWTLQVSINLAQSTTFDRGWIRLWPVRVS